MGKGVQGGGNKTKLVPRRAMLRNMCQSDKRIVGIVPYTKIRWKEEGQI
jgi:hypothetical protein